MDIIDTVEVCWTVLQKYIKNSDESNAVSHLVAELLDAGLADEDIEKLSAVDSVFADAVKEHFDDESQYWYVDDNLLE
jgi:hypothetical protein